MGSGKSSVGRLLAKKIGWQFIDLDLFIENRYRKSVSQIFSENGEENYNDYINKRRIELSKELLVKGVPVNRIAERCGFNSDTSFRRVFIRYTKISPRKFGEINRAAE